MTAQIGRALIRWLIERLRDILMWPTNLLRDFPVRAKRLAHTLWRAAAGSTNFLMNPRRRADRAHENGRSLQGDFFSWLHQLLAQSFDLIGGPEILQFLMHLITNTTPLTDDEIAMISAILGPGKMRYKEIRVAEGGLLESIFRRNGSLAFSTWHTVHFPRHEGGRRHPHTRSNLPIVVHELTHVYQYHRVGSRYLGEAIYQLIKTKRNCYDYGSIRGLEQAAAAGKQFSGFNREQQAQIVQDYFTLMQKDADVKAYEPFIRQLRDGAI